MSAVSTLRDVRYFVLVYDRSAGEVLELREYAESARAMEEGFGREREERASSKVVVLGAASAEALRRTHARYFTSVPALPRWPTNWPRLVGGRARRLAVLPCKLGAWLLRAICGSRSEGR